MKFNFNKKNLIRFLPILILTVVICICVGVGIAFIGPNHKNDDKVEVGISSELQKDKKFLNLTLQDIEIEEGEYITHLMANVYNHGEAFSDQMVDIVFLDREGKELGRTPTYISAIEGNGVIRIDTVIDKKFVKAYTFKVEG